jgi:putative transposase
VSRGQTVGAVRIDYCTSREYHTCSRLVAPIVTANAAGQMKSTIAGTDTTFITNEGEKTLRDRFRVLIKDTRFFDALVGHFYTSGFYALYKSLENTEKIRILIGMSTSKQTSDLIQAAQSPVQGAFEFSHAETKEEFSNIVAEEMETSEDDSAVEEGVEKFTEWLLNGKLEIKAYPSENIHAKIYIMTFVEGDKDIGRTLSPRGQPMNVEIFIEGIPYSQQKGRADLNAPLRWTKAGRACRILNIIHEYTRECLAMLIARRIRNQDVIDLLFYLFIIRGIPEHIRSDNGPEFTARAVRKWLARLGVKTLFIEPGSPWENGYVESFNGKLRDELLNREIFTTLEEAKVLIEQWRRDYYQVLPHSSLGYRPPAPEAILSAITT